MAKGIGDLGKVGLLVRHQVERVCRRIRMAERKEAVNERRRLQ
jgi:hypothetical protein